MGEAGFEQTNGLRDDELVRASFQPLLAAYKEASAANGDLTTLFRSWTSGQRALFISYSYIVHVIESPQEAYWWSAFFMAQGRWAALRASADELDAKLFADMLSDIQTELHRRGHPIALAEAHRIQREDLEQDDTLGRFFVEVYERLTSVAAKDVIARSASAMRLAPEEFRLQT
ncbi:hypothetical protein [Paenibacillus methanolicus]|uniref:hypothetical protein n=1 Tax=Paenibacillus methanolicus TaxID=582686 RepID=UPI0011E80686|nr:hypothetical protein [Paenibacillus methanolicus]